MPKFYDKVDVLKKPGWLKIRLHRTPEYAEVQQIVDKHALHTICSSGMCPNKAECWSRRTATFMILGDICTRGCRFCATKTGHPLAPDAEEPRRVAESVALMKLRYVVVTSVTRDDLPDGGAAHFASTIRQIRRLNPGCGVEVLIPDFMGDPLALETVLEARPEVLNHNLETVPRLYPALRPQADYRRSLQVLSRARQWADGFGAAVRVKTGIMVGVGETYDEVLDLMRDAAAHGIRTLTIGQYLQPTAQHHPVTRWVTPDEFDRYAEAGRALGIEWVESGPLVRSSYHAREQSGVDERSSGSTGAAGAGAG